MGRLHYRRRRKKGRKRNGDEMLKEVKWDFKISFYFSYNVYKYYCTTGVDFG